MTPKCFTQGTYWQCKDCGILLITDAQDDASIYECPTCKISSGSFQKVSSEDIEG